MLGTQKLDAFHSLQKKDETSMQDHINEFTRLQQEVDYHRGTIPVLSVQINPTKMKHDIRLKAIQSSQSFSSLFKTYQLQPI